MIIARTLPSRGGVRLWAFVAALCLALPGMASSDTLFYRYQQADTTLTHAQLRELFFRYSETEAYVASLGPVPQDPLLAVRQRPLSLDALYRAAVAMKRQGEIRRSGQYALQMWMLGEMVYNEFAGDVRQPYPVLYREDERWILYNWNHIDSIVKETRKAGLDVVECALPPDWTDSFCFQPLFRFRDSR